MKKCVTYLVLLLLAASVLCTPVSAAENSNAYVRSVCAYIHRWGPGDISVEYYVTGTDIMDTIGAHKVTVYRLTGETQDVSKDELVANYWHEYTPGMMTTGSVAYSHSIRLQVEPGEKYYAVVIFYATLDGGGDDMAFSTKPVMA